MTIRSFLYRLGAVAIGLALGITIAEVTLRLLHLAPTGGVATVTSAQYEALPGIFAPNQQLMDLRNRNLPHEVTIDSLGYRGSSFPRRKAAGEFRILVVGDSHVYGDFVDNDETLPAQLERELRGRCHDVRVINAGLGGSTIVDQKRLVERAISLQPDLVVLVFSENDVKDLRKSTPLWQELAENRRLKSETLFSVIYPALRRTALWNLALKVRARLATGSPKAAPVAPTNQVATAPDAVQADLRLRELYEQALLELRDHLYERGIPLYFAAFPSHLTVSGVNPPERMSWVTSMAEEAGMDAISFLEPLRDTGLPDTTLFLLPHDGHPSPHGYGIAAAHLADRLQGAEALPAECSEG